MIPVFFPPGVQVALAQILPIVPTELPPEVCAKYDRLMMRRRAAPDAEVDAIDAEMIKVVGDYGRAVMAEAAAEAATEDLGNPQMRA